MHLVKNEPRNDALTAMAVADEERALEVFQKRTDPVTNCNSRGSTSLEGYLERRMAEVRHAHQLGTWYWHMNDGLTGREFVQACEAKLEWLRGKHREATA